MQSCTTGIREHVKHIELFLPIVFHYTVSAILNPPLLPFLLNVSEIIFHCFSVCIVIQSCKVKEKSGNAQKNYKNNAEYFV
jgi:hypothetical protein